MTRNDVLDTLAKLAELAIYYREHGDITIAGIYAVSAQSVAKLHVALLEE